MASKNSKTEHGLRNKELCIKLHQEGKYTDWTVTTAFYSVIHLVEGKLLPIEIKGQKCNNIAQVRKAYNQPGRHASRAKLVEDNLRSIATRYKWLDDQSRNSRYKTYKISKTLADKALQYVNEIQKECVLSN